MKRTCFARGGASELVVANLQRCVRGTFAGALRPFRAVGACSRIGRLTVSPDPHQEAEVSPSGVRTTRAEGSIRRTRVFFTEALQLSNFPVPMLTAKIGGLTYLVIPGLLYACWKLWRTREDTARIARRSFPMDHRRAARRGAASGVIDLTGGRPDGT